MHTILVVAHYSDAHYSYSHSLYVQNVIKERFLSGDSVEWSSALDEVCEMPEAFHKTRDNQVGAR